MNRKILSALIIIACALQVNAQKSPINLFVKGGANISSGRVSTDEKYSGSGVGFHGGVVGDYKINDQFSIQPGAMISTKNAKINDLGGINISMVVLDIPIMGLYHKNRFFGGIGPDFNIGLTGKFKYRGEKYDLFDKESDARFSIKRLEIAANALAGYYLKDNMFVSANFNMGLNNLFNYSEVAGSNTKVKTSVFAVSFGYAIGK